MRTNSQAILFILSLSFLTGCTTTESLLASRGKEGKVFVCASTYDQVYKAVLQTLRDQRFKIITKDKNQGYVITSDKIRFLNGGGRMAIYLSKLESGGTQVEVLSKPYFFIPTPTIYWAANRRASQIQEGINRNLTLSQSV